jgi:hypothetical protein
MKQVLLASMVLALLLPSAAQVAQPAPSVQARPSQAVPANVPVVGAELAQMLNNLEQAAQTANVDVAKLRIEKWKADGSVKQQLQGNADSIQRNLTNALPGMIQQVRTNPQDLAASFKLYRNLNALYDVFSTLAESAGAFGPKNDYEALSTDVVNLDKLRLSLGNHLENLAVSKDQQIQQLRQDVQRAQAAATPPPPPKKIVVEDEQPKQHVVKKKATTKKPAEQQTKQPAQTPPNPGKQ